MSQDSQRHSSFGVSGLNLNTQVTLFGGTRFGSQEAGSGSRPVACMPALTTDDRPLFAPRSGHVLPTCSRRDLEVPGSPAVGLLYSVPWSRPRLYPQPGPGHAAASLTAALPSSQTQPHQPRRYEQAGRES